jgi:hypothetical protein
MAKRDTRKTARYSNLTQAWSLDIMPHKSTKKAKAKERQQAKKLVDEELKWLSELSGIGFGLKED